MEEKVFEEREMEEKALRIRAVAMIEKERRWRDAARVFLARREGAP
jgi:hypothetical protein